MPANSPRSKRVKAMRYGSPFAGAAALALLASVLAACNNSPNALNNPAATASTAKPAKAVPAPMPVETETASLSLSAPPMVPAGEPGAVQRAPVKVGLILPLSGPGQAPLVAEAMKLAAELALRDLKANHVQLVVRDDKGTPEGAMTAATEVMTDGVEIILGPLYARSVASVSAMARSKNAPVIAFSNDRQVASSSVHLLSFLAGPEVTRVVSYAAKTGKRRYVALIPDDAYGKLVDPQFKEAVARNGGQVLASQAYPTDGRTSQVLAAMKTLRDEMRGLEEHGDPIDAIFIPGGEETVQLIGPLLKQAEIDVKRIKIIGTGALDTPNAGRDDAFVGAWYAAPDPRGFKDFSERFVKAYNRPPPRITTLAYDAASLAATLATAPDGARFIPSALTRAGGFNGVDGLFRLMSDGVTDRALAVLEVQKGGARLIEQPARNVDGGNGYAAGLGAPTPGSYVEQAPASSPGAITKIN